MTEIVNYYTALFSRTDQAAYVAIVMAGIAVVLTLVGFLKGITRGIGRQGVRTITVVLSVVLAYFGTHSMLPVVLDIFEDKSILDILATVKLDGIITALAPEFADLLASMEPITVAEVLITPVAVFVLPLLFIILFILISGFMLLVHACVCGILGYAKKRNNGFTRLLGALLGLAQGAFVAIILLIPICGIANVTEEASVRFEDEEPGVVDVVYETYFSEVTKSPLHKFVTKYGGEFLYKKLATVTINKTPTDARESVYNILHIADTWQNMGDANLSQMNESQRVALNEIVNTIAEDPCTATAVAGLIRTVMSTDTVTDVVLAKFDEPFRGFFAEWIEILSHCTKDTVHEDLDTIVDVIVIMADHGVLEAFMAHNADDMRNAMISVDENGDTAIHLLVGRFQQNERTAHLVTTLARLSISLMVGESDLGLDEDTLDTFNNVKDGLAENVLTIDKSTYGEDTDAYVSDVADALDTTLTEAGIDLSDDALTEMAEYISENNEQITALETLDDVTVTNILIQYYTAYMSTTNP